MNFFFCVSKEKYKVSFNKYVVDSDKCLIHTKTIKLTVISLVTLYNYKKRLPLSEIKRYCQWPCDMDRLFIKSHNICNKNMPLK